MHRDPHGGVKTLPGIGFAKNDGSVRRHQGVRGDERGTRASHTLLKLLVLGVLAIVGIHTINFSLHGFGQGRVAQVVEVQLVSLEVRGVRNPLRGAQRGPRIDKSDIIDAAHGL